MTLLIDDPPVQRAATRRARWRDASGWLPVLLPALLAAALTAYRYDAKPLWRDEVYTLSTAGRGVGDMMGLLSERDAGLVGYYLVMHPWLAVSEASWWIRLPGAVATVVLVALVAVLARRFAGPWGALVAGTLAALAPAVYVHGQEARPYPMALTAVVVTVLLLLRATHRPRAWLWPLTGAVALLAVALHPLVTLPSVGAAFFAVWLRPGRASRWALVLTALPAGLAGAALVVAGSLQAAARPPAPATLPEYFTFWRLASDVPWLGWPLLALAVVGAAVLARRARRGEPGARHALVPVLWAPVPVLAITVLGLTGGYFNARYASAAVPPAAVLAAVALTAAPAAARRAARGRRWAGWAAVAAVVALLGALAPGGLAYRAQRAGFDDPQGAARQIAAQAQPGDAVVYVGNVVRPMLEAYYPPGLAGGDRLDDALLVASPEDSDTLGGLEVRRVGDKVAALAPHQRVWLVGSVATATEDLGRTTGNARAAMDGRRLVSSTDHNWLRVELWELRQADTTGATASPEPPGVAQ
ncbi:glycosyltransferase family 39 protein [Quadrisphaera sp. KR29]|uniref:glycosyltransferase family 39 protein n=1 Tax=Quadrisphaera sp. KR29 TaxID=3461391 RepID=UPI00404407D4